MPDENITYDENTLLKVRRALGRSLNVPQESHVVTNAITDMQNDGILFREIAPGGGEETACSASSDGQHCVHWYDDPEADCCYEKADKA